MKRRSFLIVAATALASTLLLPGIAISNSMSVTMGKGLRWVKSDGEWRDTIDVLAGVSYNTTSSKGDAGWTFSWKTGGAGDDTVNRYSAGQWWKKGHFEPFVDVALSTWGKRKTGEFELLGGGEVGCRVKMGTPTFQISGSMAAGNDGNWDVWMYLGFYVNQAIREEYE